MKKYIIWILKYYNEEAFTDPVEAAWETFFECIWHVLGGSKERIRIKELKERKAREMEEKKAKGGKGTKKA